MLDLNQPVLGEDFQIINPVEARLAHRDAQEFIVMTESGDSTSLHKLSTTKTFYFVQNEHCNCS